MSFSGDAWQRILPLYAAILELPFNRELAAGTLARERFTFYMLQDAHYLTFFGRALAITAGRAPDTEAMIEFAGSAREAVLVERALQRGLLSRLRHLAGRGAGDRAFPDLCPLHPLPAGARPQRAVRSIGRGAPALLLDLLGGRQAICTRARSRATPIRPGSTPTPTRPSPRA
jgi:TENA/THI-4/PQQC family